MEGTDPSGGLLALLNRRPQLGVPSQGPAGKGHSPGQAKRKRIRAALRKAGITKGARTQGGGLR